VLNPGHRKEIVMQAEWRKRRSALSVVAIVSAFVSVLGCASDSGGEKTPGEQRAGAAVTGLKETRTELAAGRAQIDKTVAAMNALRDGQGQLPAKFATFNAEVKKTEEHAAKTRARAADMRARAGEYQSKWRQEAGKIDDPALRAAANARAEQVRERYDGITTKANEARAAYEPFMKQLKGVQTYLSNDLTPAGVKSAGDVFDRATADGKTVSEKISAVIAELDSVASDLAPTAPSSEKAAPKK
jgi:chromosome segregation ATPase